MRGLFILLALAMLLIVAAAVPWVLSGGMRMGAPPATQAQVAAAVAGQPLNVALEVTEARADGVVGTLLQPDASGDYQRTTTALSVALPGSVPVQMGRTSDIRPGAVIQVAGVVNAGGGLDGKRVTILTSVVKLR